MAELELLNRREGWPRKIVLEVGSRCGYHKGASSLLISPVSPSRKNVNCKMVRLVGMLRILGRPPSVY